MTAFDFVVHCLQPFQLEFTLQLYTSGMSVETFKKQLDVNSWTLGLPESFQPHGDAKNDSTLQPLGDMKNDMDVCHEKKINDMTDIKAQDIAAMIAAEYGAPSPAHVFAVEAAHMALSKLQNIIGNLLVDAISNCLIQDPEQDPEEDATIDNLESMRMMSTDAKRMLCELKDGPGFNDSRLSVKQTAMAYDIVQTIRQRIGTGQWTELEKVARDAAKVVREALVLQCITATSSPNTQAFEAALTLAFGRIIDAITLSQMYLSRSTIARLGKDKAEFDKAAVLIFQRQLSDEQCTLMFEAYNVAGLRIIVKEAKEPRRKSKSSKSRQHPKDMAPGEETGAEHATNATPMKVAISPWLQASMQPMPRQCDACGMVDWTCSQNKLHALWCARCWDEYEGLATTFIFLTPEHL